MLRFKLRPGDTVTLSDGVTIACSTMTNGRRAFVLVEAPPEVRVSLQRTAQATEKEEEISGKKLPEAPR